MNSLPSTDPSLDKAETFLKSQGFNCQREPSWVLQGRKPDFFCEGQVSLWVEVKTLSDTEQDRKQTYLWEEVRTRAPSVRAHGVALALASIKAKNKDVKIALALAQRLLSGYEATNETWRRAFVVVPSDPIYNSIARLTVEEEQGPVRIISCESRSGRYELPFGLEPRSYEEQISITLNGSALNPVPLCDIEESGHPLFALDLNLGSAPFEVASLFMVDGEARLRNSERLRACVKDASNQIRNGQRYREAPSIVLVYQDHVLVPADISIVAALYGDITYEFTRGTRGTGRFFYGQNGVFRPGKNTSVSAVCIIRNSFFPLKSARETLFPSRSVRAKSGAFVPT